MFIILFFLTHHKALWWIICISMRMSNGNRMNNFASGPDLNSIVSLGRAQFLSRSGCGSYEQLFPFILIPT